MRQRERTTGVALALLAASLFVRFPADANAHSDAEKEHGHSPGAVNGKCVGGNACQGRSACKTSNSQCAGQNACKGQGFAITTEDACEAADGSFEDV